MTERSIVVVTIVAFLPSHSRRSIGPRLARLWLEYGGHESLHQVPVHYPGEPITVKTITVSLLGSLYYRNI